MKHYLTMLIAASSCASVLAVQAKAQTTESKTKVKAEHGTVVMYTGCVQAGTETRTYILQNAVPMTKTETTGTSGTSTTTTYALIPTEKIELQQHVGHKVQVSAVLVPAGKGDTKIKTTKKDKGGTQEATKTEVERGPLPQLRVVSVTPLAESC